MNGPAIDAPRERAAPVRPAILLGYGDFGHTVIRRLLTSAALRGTLEWTSPGGGASPGERRLRDLAPIHLEDPLADADPGAPEPSRTASRIEVMQDLYRQIRHVAAGENQAERLADAAHEAIEHLLAAPLQHRRGGRPGIDVFVISQPADARAIGTLDRLVRSLMKRLHDPAFLRRRRRTSFVAILDFTSYWARSGVATQRRRVLRKSVEHWRRRRGDGQPAFDRFYLVDGSAEAGVAGEKRRIEEIDLLLELMLFEGQRGELQRLFQMHNPGESPVYAFGVRLMERRADLFSRRAAATFGHGWLRYLSGKETGSPEDEPARLRERLASYTPAALEASLDLASIRARLRSALRDLGTELTESLASPAGDWPKTVRERYEAWESRTWRELSVHARERMEELRRESLARLETDLEEAIEHDLHQAERPVPLGAVLRELDRALAVLEDEPVEDEPVPRRDLGLRLRAMGRRYRHFLRERIHLSRLPQFWPLLALATATGAAPLLSELLRDLPQPDPMGSLLWTRAWETAQLLSSPLFTGPAVFAVTWLVGALWVQRRFRNRLARAERVFLDPRQGMLVDRLREALGPGGSLRRPLEARLERRLEDMVQAARSSVRREVGRMREMLRRRRREMDWLRVRLEEFETVHGGEVTASDDPGLRIAAEGPEEYERILGTHPAQPERFRSAQREHRPFDRWNRLWCDAFLHPLDFIERLSTLYEDPIEQELVRPRIGPEQELWADRFVRFVEEHGSSPLSFHWDSQEGLPPEERFCLLPPMWRQLQRVQATLLDHKVDRERVLSSHDAGRAFLLRLQGGVDPHCLTEAEDLEETA